MRWRPGAERLYGWTADEITGHSMSRLGLVNQSDVVQRHLVQALRDRGTVTYEGHHVTIKANVDADKNEVHVQSLKMAKDTMGKDNMQK